MKLYVEWTLKYWRLWPLKENFSNGWTFSLGICNLRCTRPSARPASVPLAQAIVEHERGLAKVTWPDTTTQPITTALGTTSRT